MNKENFYLVKVNNKIETQLLEQDEKKCGKVSFYFYKNIKCQGSFFDTLKEAKEFKKKLDGYNHYKKGQTKVIKVKIIEE